MSTYTIPSRKIPLHDGWDVIVAGGGPAGCTAATAAARAGARTLLVEATGMLGGMGTAGHVPAWCPFSDKEKIIYRGLAERVFNASKAATYDVDPHRLDWVPIDPEALKRIYDELVTEAGVTVRFGTTLAAVEAADGDASTVVTASKAGLEAWRARVYVDCTGDGDLAAWAGAEFEKADELQPATACFTLGGVDDDAYRTGGILYGHAAESPMQQIAPDERYPLVLDTHMCSNLVGFGGAGFNAGHLWGVDGTDPDSLSRAMIDGRRQTKQLRDGLAAYRPDAFARSWVASTGALMGIRETRRITGDYVLTLDDYLARRSFADEICRNSYFVDVHRSLEESRREAAGEIDMGKRLRRYEPGESHGLPYRCLTPKGLRNVLVAGRNLSAERMVHGSVRVMPVCLCMGEAAGIAAAMAARADGDIHAVDTDKLRDDLREHGAYLPEA